MRHASLITTGVVMTIAAASGRAAAPQTTVRNHSTCGSLKGLAIPVASIGLPTTGATIHATFPKCRYPMYPRYKDVGDPKSADSYRCVRAGAS